MAETLFDITSAECTHQRSLRIPAFPGDALVCADCGAEGCKAGYTNGVRDYYLPGDPSWRRQAEVTKLEWLAGGDDLEQCPECCFVGTLDDFDVMGAKRDYLFCNQCGVEFEQ